MRMLILFVVIHIGHVDRLGVLLIDEYIGFDVFDALAVDLNVNSESRTEKPEDLVPREVGVQGIGLAR